MASSLQADVLLRHVAQDSSRTDRPSAKEAAERAYQSGHAWVQDELTQDVVASIRSIERMAERFGEQQAEVERYARAAQELRSDLDIERAQHEEVQRELVGLERSLIAERERALRAEHHATQAEGVIASLEANLAAVRDQMDRLLKAVAFLQVVEADAPGDNQEVPLRLAS